METSFRGLKNLSENLSVSITSTITWAYEEFGFFRLVNDLRQMYLTSGREIGGKTSSVGFFFAKIVD